MKKISCKLALIFIISTFFFQNLRAQNEVGNKIFILSKVTKNEVVLRFSPNNPILWYYANQYGYKITRQTVAIDTIILPITEEILLTKESIKPLPKEEWESQSPDKFFVIAYQAIYGQKFDVSQEKNLYSKIQNQSDDLTNRFSFALFACDNSFVAAEFSGLVFRDKNIKSNEKYLYRIYIDAPKEKIAADTAFIFVDCSKETYYPKPIGLEIDSDDKIAKLRWLQTIYDGVYNSWYVERSDNMGKTFNLLNETPFVYVQNEDDREKFVYYFDSLSTNGKRFIYRIRGISPFGDLGPYSDTIGVVSKSVLKVIPNITKVTNDIKNRCLIEWSFPNELNNEIIGFEILASTSDNGIFSKVNLEIIKPEKRNYTDEKPNSINYYKIVAIDRYKNKYPSGTYMYLLPDSLPPKPPVNLFGKIDTTGNVFVVWKKNNETDIAGYRVYFSNSLNDEFSQITKEAITDTFFTFTTTLNTLTSEIFIKVKAEDFRYNQSEFSKTLKVLRPDTIPPSAPIINNYKVSDTGITIFWTNSSSKDVFVHKLLRKNQNSDVWKTISEFKNEKNFYCDTSVVSEMIYDYAIVAIDNFGNTSKIQNSVQVQMIKKIVLDQIKGLKAKIDEDNNSIRLLWTLPQKQVKKIFIFRQIDEYPIELYVTLNQPVDFFIDKNLSINSNYQYQIKFLYHDNSFSDFSKKVSIKY